MSVGSIKDIDVPHTLQKLKITRMGRDNQRFLIQYEFQDKDGGPMPVQVYFDLKPNFFDTLEEFRKKASKRLQLDEKRIQRTIAALSNDEYCQRVLEFYEVNGIETVTKIGEQIGDDGDITKQECEQEEAYASSVSDPDYVDEGLPLLSVTSALRKDPGRICVSGTIDTVRPPFKLLTKVYFVCRNSQCSKQDIQEEYILDTPIFSLADMPIAFEGGAEEYNRFQRCATCRGRREVVPDYNKFENAKTIELKNLNTVGKVSAITANSTLSMERLAVFVVGKHTLSVGFGEEVEIVGDLYVLASGLLSSRFGGASGPRTADSGRAHPILYAKRIKYTKRERELKLTEQDIKAIKKFSSLSNLVPRLTSMMSPEIYGHDDVKLGLLLLAVGPAPIQKDNWYRRHWLNAGLFGDKGTGKTTLAEDASKLLPGSQTVSGQHSTGKGIVAIAEKDVDNNGAILRAGAATLANNAICFIDEIGTMNYDDQNQFLSLMEKGYFDFNKLGIRQRIEAKPSFIVTANPITGDWQNSEKISQSEIPLKGQLLDRLDFFFVLRKPRTPQEHEDFANNMLKLSKKHFKLDFLFLRKYIYYVRSNSEFLEIDFKEPYCETRLKDFWINLMSANPEAAGNRSFESVFRTAKAFARLMLKNAVDFEVVDQTIKFIGSMFETHGTQITPTVDYRIIAFLGICKAVKEHSQNLSWAQQNSDGGIQLSDITFNQAGEIAAQKNANIRQYLGENFRSNNNRAARHLREMFREGQERDYDGGKIKVVSTDKHTELRLRWIANGGNTNGTN
jgi:DNA replicative helicase MCM subunit Mcm2 (Cdc46/Mcm family)